MPRYLMRRKNRWYIRLPVPKVLWDVIGKRALVRSTGTDSLEEARRLRFKIVAELQDEIESAANADPATTAWLDDQAVALRASVERGELDAQLASDIISDLRERHLKARDKSHLTPAELSHLQRTHRVASDLDYRPLTSVVDTYIDEKSRTLRPSSIDDKRRHLDLLTGYLRGDPDVNEVSRKDASAFLTDAVMPLKVSLKTQKDYLASLTAFFNWCIRRAYYDHPNPFSGLSADLNGTKRGGTTPSKRAYTADELKSLFSSDGLPDAMPYQLRSLAAVSLYAGLRRDEAASLQVTDIDTDEWTLTVREGKTEAAVRTVPVHSKLRPVIEKLTDGRTEGKLFVGLKPTGRDKKLGHEAGKRYSYWLRQNLPSVVANLDNGRTYAVADFHSLRRSWLTALEEAGVAERTAQQLAGHTRGLAYGTYSKGVSIDRLRDAIEAITFPSIAL